MNVTAFDLDSALRQHTIWAEDVRRFPYEDSVGILSIAVGRNLEHRGLNDDEIALMLKNDLALALSEAQKLDYFNGLDPVRQLVIRDMVFNMGLPRFRGFVRTNAALRAGNYRLAAREMIDSKWYRQTGRRAQRLVVAMDKGVWK